MEILLDQNGNGALKIGQDTDGSITFNGIDAGGLYQTGVFRRLSFSYDTSQNRATLFYDGTNLLPWTDLGGSVATQFNRLAVQRLNGDDPADNLYVDSISVNSFPRHTYAWWRMDDWDIERLEKGNPSPLGDALNRFPQDRVGYDSPNAGESRSSWVHDAEGDVHNRHSYQHAIWGPGKNLQHTPLFTNWTVEAVLRLREGVLSKTFFAWGRPGPTASTKAWIRFGTMGSTNQLTASLRDGQQSFDSYDYLTNLGEFPNDDQWHHVAAVKSGSTLTTYVDYQPLATLPLNYGQQTYYFDTNTLSQCTIGFSLNGGNAFYSKDLCDEVRFSFEALPPEEFLQSGDPIWTSPPCPITPAHGTSI